MKTGDKTKSMIRILRNVFTSSTFSVVKGPLNLCLANSILVVVAVSPGTSSKGFVMFSCELKDSIYSAIRVMSVWFVVEPLVLVAAEDHQDTDDDCKGDSCVW